MRDVIATEIEHLDVTQGTLLDAAAVQDFAGNVFEAEANLIGNTGGARVTKRNTAGVMVDQILVHPEAGRKIDGCAILISGSDIHIYVTDHNPDAANHFYGKGKYVWQGIAVPYPQGIQPIGAAGVYGGSPSPPTTDPVLQALSGAITAIVRAVVGS